jgi:hypothetical protein
MRAGRLEASSGRPTLYTEELGQRICELLADGQTLTRICRENADLPSDRTIRRWALDREHPFSPQYARAREIGYHAMADATVDTADSEGTDPGQVARDRLKVDTRKWLLSKALPKIYGDKLAIAGDPTGSPVELRTIERIIVAHGRNDVDA